MSLPVLLLMDYQEAICRPDGLFGAAGMGLQAETRGVLKHAASVLSWFRMREYPVVHARLVLDEHGHRIASVSPSFETIRANGLMREGDPATDICSEVRPLVTEPVIAKCGFSPFTGTNLETMLHRLCPTQIVMGGVSTNHVVESAVRYASDVGFRVTVLEDLCAANSEPHHRFAVDEVFPAFAHVTDSASYLSMS
jgi:nicotinamidase-related amidase